MRVSDVKFQVEQIKAIAGRDDEAAHSMEDELFIDVLKAIAKGSRQAKALAREALKSKALQFPRHCS